MIFEVEAHETADGGSLFKPLGAEPLPSILVLHGSEGGDSGWSHLKAMWLAQYGFNTYPLNYSVEGSPWHAGNIVDVDLARTQNALHYLREEVSLGKKVGIYGFSRGAEHALLLASLMAKESVRKDLPDAIAVHSPTDTVAGPFRPKNHSAISPELNSPLSPAAWRWKGSSKDILLGTPIKIERYQGPVFISHGTADTIWSCQRSRNLEVRLRAAGHSPEIHYYDGQGHTLDKASNSIQQKRLVAFFKAKLSS
ncbi:BAAT / Acyl-CoA thioester hydrolase C terminal domain family protein [Verrucomicrobiia bacterium DG1235]|nr:BAAT / Acyl-CoA thioester hydrolase C terminal domain family protein [Verrucomicrobiae bacterium DG1235]